MQLAIIAALSLAIAAVSFAMQNNVPVTVNFMLWRFDSSLAMVLLIAAVCGAFTIALLTTPATLKRQWRQTRQKQRIKELEKTLAQQAERIADLEAQANHIPAQAETPPARETLPPPTF